MNAAAHTQTATPSMPLSHLRRSHRPQRVPERIVLTGFMGSGKSTIGPLLATNLGWTFVDLDSVIEQRTGLSIPHLFAEKGEEAFRREETSALVATLGHPHTVIALGGGAPETLANRLLLEQTPATLVVFLAAPFDTLASRCAHQAADASATARPVFADPALAEQRFATRQPLYSRLAHLTFETADLSAADCASAIASTIAARASRA